MQINELQPGDILLFSAEPGSFISWAITFLTNAPVSHAAMYYDAGKQTIIEETPPQITVNDAAKRFKGRTIYVQRLKSNLPLQPVINQAGNCLNNLEPYDKTGLYTVGMLLIYKKLSLNTAAQKTVIRILKKLTASVMDYVHRHETPGKTPMVCSQFVAHCYEKAGHDYQLKFENSLLQKNSLLQSTGSSLLEQATEIMAAADTHATANILHATTTSVTEDAETLCRELKTALETTQPGIAMDYQLAETIAEFAAAHTQTDHIVQAMHDLARQLSMYVFPGDLLLHCTSTTKAGEITL